MCQVRASDLSTHPSPWSVTVARPCCFLGPARFSRVGCWRHFHVLLDSGRLFKNFFKHLNIFLYSFVCVCMHTRACMQHVWRSEDNFRYSALSYHHLGSGEQSQIFRLGSQHLYLLGHLTSPMGRLFKWHLGTPENMSHLSGYGLVRSNEWSSRCGKPSSQWSDVARVTKADWTTTGF